MVKPRDVAQSAEKLLCAGLIGYRLIGIRPFAVQEVVRPSNAVDRPRRRDDGVGERREGSTSRHLRVLRLRDLENAKVVVVAQLGDAHDVVIWTTVICAKLIARRTHAKGLAGGTDKTHDETVRPVLVRFDAER